MKRASSLRFRRPKPTGRSWAALGRFSTVVAWSGLLVSAVLMVGRPADGGDDVLVTGTAADRAGDSRADLLIGWIRIRVEQRTTRHQHPGGAEAALQGVQLVESLLDRVELPVHLQRLDRAD